MTEALPDYSIVPAATQPELPSMSGRRVTQGAGAILVLLGLTVMTGWLLHLPGLLQVVPGQVAMVFSTALCFALAGAALLAPMRWTALRSRANRMEIIQERLFAAVAKANREVQRPYALSLNLGSDKA